MKDIEGNSEELGHQTEKAPQAADPKAGSTVVAYEERRFTIVGPLPPPAILADYDEICPGAADRIISMAERQSAHRQALEDRVIESNCISQQRGPVFGFILSTMVISIGGVLLWNGKDIAGLAAILGPLAGIAATFVASKVMQRNDLRRRRFEDPSESKELEQPSS